MKAYALTVDLHDDDDPADIATCSDWLATTRRAATFFIPTALLERRRFHRALRHVAASGHEVASHGHAHDDSEIRALGEGSQAAIEMLRSSRALFADFFGFAPRAFRAPAWGRLHSRTIDALCELGYLVDSSATPQRFGIFSSYPTDNPWLLANRRIHLLRERLVEIPTSCFAFPLGSPSFRTFRQRGSLVFLSGLLLEAGMRDDVAIVVQFHPDDLVSKDGCHPVPGHLALQHLIPRTPGGIAAKHWLRERRGDRIFETAMALCRMLTRFEPRSLGSIRDAWVVRESCARSMCADA